MVQEMGDGPDRPFPEDRAPAPHDGPMGGIRDRRHHSGAPPCDWSTGDKRAILTPGSPGDRISMLVATNKQCVCDPPADDGAAFLQT